MLYGDFEVFLLIVNKVISTLQFNHIEPSRFIEKEQYDTNPTLPHPTSRL